MSSLVLLSLVIGYFLLLLFVSWKTGKGSDNESFFIGNRNSNWMLVAFGMIGTSLSGVTFVSVPGQVKMDGWHYLQVTFGFMLGYIAIAYILLPLYYRLKLTSIYDFLRSRLGFYSYKTGATFFIVSRLVGATARLYLVINILQDTILNDFGIPFWITALVALSMILLYTFKGGVKTIVWTDTLQTTGMLLGLIICNIYLLHNMNFSILESLNAMHSSKLNEIFDTNINDKTFFIKQVLAGMFITIAMTGIDQEMMQKSISVTSLKDSQKNMVTLAFIMAFVIFVFLFLGGLLYLYAEKNKIAASGDDIFPVIALHYLPHSISVIFIIALISALFPSADGAMTALTASICIDILGMNRNQNKTEEQRQQLRQRVHLLVALSFFLMVILFKIIDNKSMIGIIMKLAGYTYGPLLGLFAFGIFSKRQVKDKLVFYICLIAPTICFFIDENQPKLFGDFRIGWELLIINGALTYLGLLCISTKNNILLEKSH